MGNQSTDCDDIVTQFKSNQIQSNNVLPNSATNQQSLLTNGKETHQYNSSESDDQLVKGLVHNKNQSQLQNTNEETKVQHSHNQKQNESKSSSPSSTSSDDDKSDQNKQLNRVPSTEQPKAINENLQDKRNDEIQRQNSQEQLFKNSIYQDNQRPGSQKQSTTSIVEQPQQQQQNQESSGVSDEEEDEDDDDEDEVMQNETNIVVEVSPKGRFKRFGEELGRGAYKIVYKGVDNETGREIAWNVINLNRLPKQDRVRIKSEIDLIKKLEHKNIIHFISAWVNKLKDQVVFITEMITGGSLRSYVKRIKNPRLRVVKGWCSEILQGLVYLHQQKPHPIIHRDLKCDNIFINSNSGEIRIGDLGLSTPMQNSYTTSVLGTPEFMAPELYEECYGTSVDVYAFGMCVLEMITLERPYKECQNPAQIYNKVIQGIRPRALERIEDEEVKEFILWCLSSADTRPSAQELLESKFIKDVESDKNNREVKVRPPIKVKGPKRKKSIQYKIQKHGSTILEEEEENSEDDDKRNQQQQQELPKPLIQNSEEKKKEQHSQVSVQDNVSVSTAQSTIQGEPQQLYQPQSKTVTEKQTQPQTVVQTFNEIQTEQTQTLEPQSQAESLQTEECKDQEKLAVLEESQLSKKQKKSGSKNKKLNESVIFLKQIDKEKQKKLQERTMRLEQNQGANDDQQNDTSSDDDGGDANNQENMLGELMKLDKEFENSEQMKMEMRMAQQVQQSFNQIANGQQMQQQFKQQQFEQQQLIAQQSQFQEGMNQQQIQYYQQQIQQTQAEQQINKLYDSSDQLNNKTPSQSQNQNRQASFNQIPDFKKDKKDAVSFQKAKNFKEDTSKVGSQSSQNQKALAIQQQRSLQQNENQQVFSQQRQSSQSVTLMTEEARKQATFPSNNDNYGQNNQQQIYQAQQVNRQGTGYTSQQSENQKKNSAPFYHQNSDSQISSQTIQIKAGSMIKPKNANYGSGLIENNKQVPDSLFDNQSSSSESSQNSVKDPDVDNIQMPRQQSEDVNLQYQPHKSVPATPFNDNIQHFQQFPGNNLGRSSAEVLYHHSVKKNQIGSVQQNVQSSQSVQNMNQLAGQQQINQLILQQQQQAQKQQQAQSQVKMPVLQAQAPQQQLKQSPQQQQQDQPQQKGKQSIGIDKTGSGQFLQSQQQPSYSQQYQQNQQQQLKTGKKSDDQQLTPSQIQQLKQQQQQNQQFQKQNFTQVILSPDSAVRKENKNKLNMSFKIKSFDGSPDKEVTFDFDISSDTASGVAEEMVKELQLPQNYIEVISKQIKNLIEKNYTPSGEPQKSSQDTPKSQDQVLSQAQSKKESPTKITKESAVSLFNKLFEGIDNFFQIMQSKNIETTDEIIEAMDCSSEEMQMKLEFLNKVFKAKKEYKRGIEEYRKKIEIKKKQASESQIKQQQQNSSQQKQTQDNKQMQQVSMPLKPTQSALNQHQIPQQQQQVKKSINDETLKRVNSNQDVLNIQHFQEKKEITKITATVPHYVRKQFKVAPAQFVYPNKLPSILKKVELETCEEDVMALQNVLNLIFEVSILQMINNPSNSQETQQFILNYIPLRIDGFYGEKTEAHVVRFQNHIKVQPDGMVNEHLWGILQNYIDHIQKQEEQRQQQIQFQQQQLQQQQDQKFQQKERQQQPSQIQTKHSHQSMPQPYSKDRLPQHQQASNQQQQLQQVSNQKSIQQQLQQQVSYQSQGRQTSPLKYSTNKKNDIDYGQVIEQAFTRKNEYDYDQGANSQDHEHDQ